MVQIFGVLIIFLQYSKMENYLYNFQEKIRKPLNNTLNQLPLAIAGFYFSSLNLVKNLKNYEYASFIPVIHFLTIIIFFKYQVFIGMSDFSGIENILAAIILFYGFYLLPLDNTNPKIKNIIRNTTNYTQGIYCLHIIIGIYVSLTINKQRNLFGAIITYIISYIISFCLMKICRKTKLKYLFI